MSKCVITCLVSWETAKLFSRMPVSFYIFIRNLWMIEFFPRLPEFSVITENAMAPHSSTLAWKIPWMEEPCGLQSMGSRRVGHGWATSLWLFTFMHWRRKWQPTPVFLPGESQGRQSLGAAVYEVTQSRTRLKWLSSSVITTFYFSPTEICVVIFPSGFKLHFSDG